jgi:hypothetical protein
MLAWNENMREFIGSRIWFDDRLAAITYAEPNQSSDGEDEWRKLGFASRLDGKPLESALLCAQVDQQLGILNKDVDWLEFDADAPCAWIKGIERGRVAAPANLLEKIKQSREEGDKATEEWLRKWGPE